MRTRWLVGLVFLWWLWPPRQVRAYEAITSFDSKIDINQDTSLSITETIKYETDEQHHGIYRYVPTEYRVNGQIVKSPISHIKVTDEQDNILTVNKTLENKNVTLKIGNPDVTFTGSKTYHISYRVDDALKQFPNHDELYWDITGEGWQIPIMEVTAGVTSPYASISKANCLAGPIGGDNGKCLSNSSPEAANFTYHETVSYNDNVTIAVAFDKQNQFIFPSNSQKLIKKIIANWFAPLIALPMLIMAWYWYAVGRDYVFINPNVFDMDPNKPYRKKPIINGSRIPFVYEPITVLTPGEAGAIMDEKVDNQDIVAEIIDLARKKYLTIKREEHKGFLSSSTDYTFEKINKDVSKLPRHQQTIMEGLFKTKAVTSLSDLKGTFYKTMIQVKQEIEDSLTYRKLYVNNPKFSRSVGLGIAITMNVLVFLIVGSALAFVQEFFWYALFGLQVILSLMLGYNTTQKTAVGSNLSMQSKGLQRTIRYGKWREEIKEKNLFIEEILPFAVALGVVKQLSQDMKVIGIEPPQYFSSPGVNALSFNSMISNFSAQAASNLAYNPASHNASGGSGFSGGSSGGGGGGGGGGSW